VWPALISLIISYSKRGHPETGFIDSHHRWMIRSFWWSQLWFLVFFVVMMIGIWPFIMDIARQVIDAGDSGYYGLNININWGQVFGTVGAAMIGGLGMALTWIWFLYRMARGMIVLGDARALP
jgi:uncharacterized membrane protein